MSSQERNRLRNSHYREYSRHKKDHCEECGDPGYYLAGDYPVRRKLTVHHIDEDVENNRPENLQTLCRKCHNKKHGQSL